MRQIITISLPQEVVKMIKEEVKNGGFASVSEFIRHIIRLWRSQKLMEDIKQSEKEYAQGEGKELKTLKDM